jgi:hypothetical protein
MTRLTRNLTIALLIVACGNGVGPSSTSQPPPAGSIPEGAGPLFVDSTDILLMESFPVQVALRVTGSLPTPCHRPVWEVHDDGSTVAVTLASVADLGQVCVQVLEPVELSIPLGTFESGSREVTLNGEPVGKFEI